MALIDDIYIRVAAGRGGDGGRSQKTFYGSANVHGDGGNGGHGGNIYFTGTSNLNDLGEFRFKKVVKANDGEKGMNKNLDGKYGDDVTVLVPFGTTIIDVSTHEAVEVLTEKDNFLIARGGRGGIGNHDEKIDPKTFRSSRREGTMGEEKELHLVLNLIADVGLIGLPSAGKSSLLKALTNATPKVGDYPFTTLEPNLGTLDGTKRTVIADIPGLIEGASEGKGLGIQFLKHIQKTKVLFHLIDASTSDPYQAYKTIRAEFENYDESLLEKDEIILLTKIDLVDRKVIEKAIKSLEKTKKKIICVSIYKSESLELVEDFLAKI